MGPSGAGECRAGHRRVDLVHEGWRRRRMGEGLEEKREDLFPGERGQQGRELHPARGDGHGEEEIWHLYTKRERGKGRMGFYGRVFTEGRTLARGKGNRPRSKGLRQVVCRSGQGLRAQGGGNKE